MLRKYPYTVNEIEKVLKESLPTQPMPLGKTHLIKHRIRVHPHATPVRHKIRRMSPKLFNLAVEEAKKWIKLVIVEFSNSFWFSALVMVPSKPAGT